MQADAPTATPLAGRTVRLTWAEGPTAGQVHEHAFHGDGTGHWHALARSPQGETAGEDAPCLLGQADEKVMLISYPSPVAGYTLSVALNLETGRHVAIASDARSWMPARGTFEFAA